MADWKVCHLKDMPECKLNHQIFKMIGQTMGFSEIDPFCIPQLPSNPKILFVEAGTSLPSSRCSPIKVESNLLSCVSSICTHPPGSQEGGGREGFNFNIDNTNLSFTDVVPRFFAAIKRNLLIPSAYY